MTRMICDRCGFDKEYTNDVGKFTDGIFYGDNGDEQIFTEDEVVCITCMEGDDE